jgi:spore coat polysaccharide biosynthesis protein SpsF
MGSSRLMGKVLRPIGKLPMLAHVIKAARASREADEVVVATTTDPQDETICDWSDAFGVKCFRGDEDDVLKRYYDAAQYSQADIIVRVTGDCPFLDPSVVDYIIHVFRKSSPRVDYAANILERTFPRGLDTEVFSMDVLAHMHNNATQRIEREHVTLHLYNNPTSFSVLSVKNELDYSDYRWTIDMPEDLTLARKISNALASQAASPNMENILDLLATHPEWKTLNSHISQHVTQPIWETTNWKSWFSTTIVPTTITR